MSNLVSQLEVQKASDRLPDVLAEIPKVRAEVGYPPLVTPLSQIVGTQAVINVLTGKRWSVVPTRDEGLHPRLLRQGARARWTRRSSTRCSAATEPLAADIRPGSLVTTTYDEVAAEIGDLAKSEEDVLMYALFPNEARTYLTAHQEGAEKAVFLMSEEYCTPSRRTNPWTSTRFASSSRSSRPRTSPRSSSKRAASKIVRAQGRFVAAAARPRSAPRRAAAAAATGARGSRARGRRASGDVEDGHRADGRHVLPVAVARARPRSSQVGRLVRRGRDAVHPRGHEAHERDRRRGGGRHPRDRRRRTATPVEYGTVLFYYEPARRRCPCSTES